LDRDGTIDHWTLTNPSSKLGAYETGGKKVYDPTEMPHAQNVVEEIILQHGLSHQLDDDWNRAGWTWTQLPISNRWICEFTNYDEGKAEGGDLVFYLSGGLHDTLPYTVHVIEAGSGPHGVPYWDGIEGTDPGEHIFMTPTPDGLKAWFQQLVDAVPYGRDYCTSSSVGIGNENRKYVDLEGARLNLFKHTGAEKAMRFPGNTYSGEVVKALPPYWIVTKYDDQGNLTETRTLPTSEGQPALQTLLVEMGATVETEETQQG
jgi:hypothetical protein